MNLDNIYHLCVAKTASMWFVAFFNHIFIKNITNMNTWNYEEKIIGWDERDFFNRDPNIQFPLKVISSPTYMSFNSYETIIKPDKYKSFCVVRDPKDIVTSFYFSARYSHVDIGHHSLWKQKLNSLDQTEGFKYAIDILDNFKMFESQFSYLECNKKDSCCKLYHFEDLFGDNSFDYFKDLVTHLEIDITNENLKIVLDAISFENFTSGRKRGNSDNNSHYRKGIFGDWKNYFNDEITKYFYNKTNNLI